MTNLTTPAAVRIAPPFWCVWTSGATATTFLAEDLMAARIAFGVETWAEGGSALFIVYDESARGICAKYGRFFKSEITLDITGTWESHEP